MSYSLGKGNTQNIADDFLGQYYGDEAQKRRQLQLLKDEFDKLTAKIHGQESQDQEAMLERDEVLNMITELKKEIQEKYGAQGGRRKKHRRTKRHSKSRRSKSRRSKSRRSKH